MLEGLRVLLTSPSSPRSCSSCVAQGVPLLLAATLVAIFLASGYGLLTRLFPERLGVFDPVAAYRLEEPLTYWNALGLFAAMGALLALGFAARAETVGRTRRGLGDAAGLPRHALFHVQPGSLDRGSSRARTWPSRSTRGRLQLLLTGARACAGPALAVLLSSHQERADADSMLRCRRRRTRAIASPSTSCCWPSQPALVGARPRARRTARRPSAPARLAFAGAAALVVVVGARGPSSTTAARPTLVRRATTRSRRPPARRPSTSTSACSPSRGATAPELWHVAWDDYRDAPGSRIRAGNVRAVLERAPPDPAQGAGRAQPLPRGARRARPGRALLLVARARRALVAAVPRRAAIRSCPLALAAYASPSSSTPPSTGTGRCARSRSLRLPARPRCSPRGQARAPRRPVAGGCAPQRVGVVARARGRWPSSASSARAHWRASDAISQGPTTTARPHRRARPLAGGAGRRIRGVSSASRRSRRDDSAARSGATGRRSRRTDTTGRSGTTSPRSRSGAERPHARSREAARLNRATRDRDFEGAADVPRSTRSPTRSR